MTTESRLAVMGDWLVQEVNQCTCGGGGYDLPHEPGCGFEPLIKLDELKAAVTAAGYALVKLPEPGPLSDHHEDDQTVWYHGQYGEFIGETVRMNPPEPKPIMDEDGNCWGIGELRDMALAALACVMAAEVVQK